MIEDVRSSMPMMPDALRDKLQHLGLDSSAAETLVEEIPAGKLILEMLDAKADTKLVKRVANWLVSEVQAVLTDKDTSWESLHLNPDHLLALASMAEDNKISSTAAKTILHEMLKTEDEPLKFAKAKNLLQVSDESKIAKIVAQVLSDNPKAAEDVKKGEAKAIGFLVGQVMKQSKGQANPELAQKLIKKQLRS